MKMASLMKNIFHNLILFIYIYTNIMYDIDIYTYIDVHYYKSRVLFIASGKRYKTVHCQNHAFLYLFIPFRLVITVINVRYRHLIITDQLFNSL